MPAHHAIRYLLITLLFALSACTTTNHRRADNLKADAKIGTGKSVVILEADIALSELLAGGVAEPRVEWTQAAETHINSAVTQELKNRNIKLVPLADTAKLPEHEQLKQLELLAENVGFAIVRFQLSPYGELPTKKDSFDWTIGPNAKLLKRAYGADYAMFSYVRDSYASGGRKAMAVLGILAAAATGVGVGVSTGQRVGYTLLVDLDTGKVVWANIMASETGDLRTAEGADKVVKSMLAGMPL